MVFNLRLTDELQREIKIEAAKSEKSMNNYITAAILEYMKNKKESLV